MLLWKSRTRATKPPTCTRHTRTKRILRGRQGRDSRRYGTHGWSRAEHGVAGAYEYMSAAYVPGEHIGDEATASASLGATGSTGKRRRPISPGRRCKEHDDVRTGTRAARCLCIGRDERTRGRKGLSRRFSPPPPPPSSPRSPLRVSPCLPVSPRVSPWLFLPPFISLDVHANGSLHRFLLICRRGQRLHVHALLPAGGTAAREASARLHCGT